MIHSEDCLDCGGSGFVLLRGPWGEVEDERNCMCSENYHCPNCTSQDIDSSIESSKTNEQDFS